MTVIRVLVVDDQDLIRQGLRTILSSFADIDVIAEATNGSEAVTLARRLKPDVTLMDIRMPILDGVEATRQLPGYRIIILTTFDLDSYVLDALRAGASGFLLKDTTAPELVRAIRAVAQGQALLSPSVTKQVIEGLRAGTPPQTPPDAIRSLTVRELEIFKMIGRGLSNSEIAEALFVSEGTVKTHVSRLLAKLQLRDRTQAAILANQTGVL